MRGQLLFCYRIGTDPKWAGIKIDQIDMGLPAHANNPLLCPNRCPYRRLLPVLMTSAFSILAAIVFLAPVYASAEAEKLRDCAPQLLGFQGTMIGQQLWPMHSPYEGPNSLPGKGDGKCKTVLCFGECSVRPVFTSQRLAVDFAQPALSRCQQMLVKLVPGHLGPVPWPSTICASPNISRCRGFIHRPCVSLVL
jgi:hypothetical protein